MELTRQSSIFKYGDTNTNVSTEPKTNNSVFVFCNEMISASI